MGGQNQDVGADDRCGDQRGDVLASLMHMDMYARAAVGKPPPARAFVEWDPAPHCSGCDAGTNDSPREPESSHFMPIEDIEVAGAGVEGGLIQDESAWGVVA